MEYLTVTQAAEKWGISARRVRLLCATMKSGIELYREVQNNPSFKKWLFDSVFNATYIADSGNRI